MKANSIGTPCVCKSSFTARIHITRWVISLKLTGRYEVVDSSLNDILHVIKPLFTKVQVEGLDSEKSSQSKDLWGKSYLPGMSLCDL